jgi:hypothetical protein
MGWRVPVAFVPLLVVELFVVVVGGVDGEVIGDPGGEFELLVDLVEQQIVLLGHHAVAVGAVLGEDLEACIVRGEKERLPRAGKGGASLPLRTLPES